MTNMHASTEPATRAQSPSNTPRPAPTSIPSPSDLPPDEISKLPFHLLSFSKRRWSIDANADASVSAPPTPGGGMGAMRRGSEMVSYFPGLSKGTRMEEIPPSEVQNKRVIAVDFDDVLAQNNLTLTNFHNKYYGTDLTIEDWTSYDVYRNRGWGTVQETEHKLIQFHVEIGVLKHTPPVPGIHTALARLRAMGHPLHIVTARSWRQRPMVLEWLKEHDLKHMFDDVHFVGAFEFMEDLIEGKDTGEVEDKKVAESDELDVNQVLLKAFLANSGKQHKIKILHAIKAELLIDDHFRNVDSAVQANPPIKSILFGAYPWNQLRWGVETPQDTMTYDERMSAGHVDYLKTLTDDRLFEGTARARDWDDVIRYVEQWDYEAQVPDQEKRGVTIIEEEETVVE